MPDLLTTKEAMTKSGIPHSTWYRYLNEGLIKPYYQRMGRGSVPNLFSEEEARWAKFLHAAATMDQAQLKSYWKLIKEREEGK